MKNIKTLTATILLGMGLVIGGCGNSNQLPPAQQNQQEQAVKHDEGISLAKAIDLAKKGEFKPQKVKFDGYTTNKVFGDEPEIIVTSHLEMGGHVKFVKIHVTDPKVIQRVAKLQDEQQNKYISGTGSIDATEITFGNVNIEVK